jgi:hypothetical protein
MGGSALPTTIGNVLSHTPLTYADQALASYGQSAAELQVLLTKAVTDV